MSSNKNKNDRYASLFDHLKQKQEGAFIPFVTLGDPDIEESFRIMETLIANGADALELGISFSDPVADGPVIQAAANRALEGGVTPKACFALIKRVRESHADIPIGLLVYANLVVHRGMDSFYEMASDAGVDSVLVADAPTDTAPPFIETAERFGIDPIFIVPPNTDQSKLKEIASLTKGYTYFLGRAGVTGADREMQTPVSGNIAFLKEAGAPPIVVGFGISRPEHIKASLEAGADGAIAGSATVAIIEKNLGDRENMHKELAEFTKRMKAATRPK